MFSPTGYCVFLRITWLAMPSTFHSCPTRTCALTVISRILRCFSSLLSTPESVSMRLESGTASTQAAIQSVTSHHVHPALRYRDGLRLPNSCSGLALALPLVVTDWTAIVVLCLPILRRVPLGEYFPPKSGRRSGTHARVMASVGSTIKYTLGSTARYVRS